MLTPFRSLAHNSITIYSSKEHTRICVAYNSSARINLLIAELFLPFLFFIFIIFVTGYIYLLTTTYLRSSVEQISALISIALSLFAIISSWAAIYYIYQELRHPVLELDVVFQELPKDFIQQQKESLIIKTLGGIYSYSIKNIGNKDAVSVEVSFKLLSRATGNSVDEQWFPIIGIGQGALEGPFFLEKLEPFKSYYGLVTIGCTNCREIKRWYFEIDTDKQSIEVKPITLSTGIWRIKEPW